jgi:hypothetical protein
MSLSSQGPAQFKQPGTLCEISQARQLGVIGTIPLYHYEPNSTVPGASFLSTILEEAAALDTVYPTSGSASSHLKYRFHAYSSAVLPPTLIWLSTHAPMIGKNSHLGPSQLTHIEPALSALVTPCLSSHPLPSRPHFYEPNSPLYHHLFTSYIYPVLRSVVHSLSSFTVAVARYANFVNEFTL